MYSSWEKTCETTGWYGAIFAIVLSWTKWHLFWWAVLHGIFGWIYVIYYFAKGY